MPADCSNQFQHVGASVNRAAGARQLLDGGAADLEEERAVGAKHLGDLNFALSADSGCTAIRRIHLTGGLHIGVILEPNTDLRKNREPLGQSLSANGNTLKRLAPNKNHFKFSNLRCLAIRTILERHSQDLRSTTPGKET